MTEHTALPWRLHRYIEFGCKCISILSGHGKANRFVLKLAGERAEEDARLIVTACNCHADLLEACKQMLWARNSEWFRDEGLTKVNNLLEQAIRKATE